MTNLARLTWFHHYTTHFKFQIRDLHDKNLIFLGVLVMCEDKKLLTKGISSNCNYKTKWQSVERGGKKEHIWKAQLMRVELRQVTERISRSVIVGEP